MSAAPAGLHPAGAAALHQYGLIMHEPASVIGSLKYERPGWVFAHRLKHCAIGAFTFFNAAGKTSVYRTRMGRYAQIGESSIIGPPEHPMDWFSSHPFAFTRPDEVPVMYQLEDFERLAPSADAGPSWASKQPNETLIGHEVYIGARSFIKRGVTIGDGAVVGAGSVVTRDVPPFAIVVGTPAKVVRQRFSDAIVERLMALQWWHYDLAPWREQIDFSKVETTLAFLEERAAAGELQHLQPDTYELRAGAGGFDVRRLENPLYRPQAVPQARCA